MEEECDDVLTGERKSLILGIEDGVGLAGG